MVSLLSDCVEECVAKSSIDEPAEFYNDKMTELPDKVAPVRSKKVSQKKCVPWFNESLKTLCRKAEARRV